MVDMLHLKFFTNFSYPNGKIEFLLLIVIFWGSMASYYISGHSMTAMLSKNINSNISILTLSFEQALPYWITAFEDVLENLEEELNGLDMEVTEKNLLISTIRMLCYPDPTGRGHIKNVKGTGNNFNMERFIEIFNRLTRKA